MKDNLLEIVAGKHDHEATVSAALAFRFTLRLDKRNAVQPNSYIKGIMMDSVETCKK